MAETGTTVRVPFWRSLSGRLLLLTVLFVLVGEVLIYVPSIRAISPGLSA